MRTLYLKPHQKVLILSDIHIGNGVKGNVERVMKILKEEDFDYVIFNGDIFELSLNSFSRIKRIAGPLFRWMNHNPTKFFYIVGNHDEYLWQEPYLVRFPLYDSIHIVQENKSFIVTHGHKFDPKNRLTTLKSKFLFLLEVLANIIFRVNWQDEIFRKKNFLYKFSIKRMRAYLETVRENSKQFAEILGADYLIHGHTHFPAIIRYQNKTIVDQGSFQIGLSYAKIENGEVKLVIRE